MNMLAALLLAAAVAMPPGEEQFTQAEEIEATQPARARTLYEQAAKLGHAEAQASLGMMLFASGKRAEALRWLRAASDQGEPRGMLLWGTALFNGDGTATDRVGGYVLVSRAVRAGLAEAEITRSEMALVMTGSEHAAATKLLDPQKPAASTVETRPSEKAKAPAKGKKSAPPKVAAKPVSSPPAAPVQPVPPVTGAWQIQLGAFRVNGSAEALFAKLSPRLPGKQASYPRAGSLTGLLVGPYPTQAEAQAACRSLGTAQPCLPVKR